ncbi:hypothetical protein [Streptomyces tricolor]|uniref:hypothetical protein n=1 Tax=Streptomyces tricolor TaxID=68277 RepID=UPI003D745ED9
MSGDIADAQADVLGLDVVDVVAIAAYGQRVISRGIAGGGLTSGHGRQLWQEAALQAFGDGVRLPQ